MMTTPFIRKKARDLMMDSKQPEVQQISTRIQNIEPIAYHIMIISGLYVLATTGWILLENRNIITVMEILTIWAAIVIVQFMAELYRGSSDKRKSQSLVALALTVGMATVTIMNHFVYLTVLNQIFGAESMPSWLLLDGWPSVTKALECAAWAFFLGLAMLFNAGVLEDIGSKVMVWTMRISGIMTLAGLVGPITGNMSYYILSTMGYSVGFLALSIEMAVHFNMSRKEQANV
jgi:hypothetical protein